MLTGSWHAVFKKVDFPALGRPIIATTAVFKFWVSSIMYIITENIFYKRVVHAGRQPYKNSLINISI